MLKKGELLLDGVTLTATPQLATVTAASGTDVDVFIEYIKNTDDGLDLSVEKQGPTNGFYLEGLDTAGVLTINGSKTMAASGKIFIRVAGGSTMRFGVSSGVPGATAGTVTIEANVISSGGAA